MHLASWVLQATGGTGGTAQVAIGSALAGALQGVGGAANARINLIVMRMIWGAARAAASASWVPGCRRVKSTVRIFQSGNWPRQHRWDGCIVPADQDG